MTRITICCFVVTVVLSSPLLIWYGVADDSPAGGAMASPRLEADLRDQVLNLKLTNSSNQAIKVDQELVFLVSVVAVDSENRFVGNRELHTLPSPDKKKAMTRFVWLQPGKSIERKIETAKPFREFVWGHSDTMAITAYEHLALLPQGEKVATIRVSYGVGHLQKEALQLYLGMWPKDLYEGPLKCSVAVRGRAGKE